MDMGCFDETVEPCFSDQETSKKLGSGPAAAAANDQPTPSSRSASSGFDCSICLDFPVDPAVTLCGHLYCWPCIYKWMMQSKAAASSPHTYCPVCKAPLSENALVPLYGRGRGGKNHHLDVPKRPNVRRNAIDASMIIGEQRRNGGDYDGYITSSVFSSTAGGVLGGLAVAVQPLLMARRPYRLSSPSPSPRERRREVLVEESLHQIWVFLLCAAVLCLLFF